MKRFFLLSLLTLFVASSFFATKSFAVNESGQALEIAPPLLTLTGDPGETIKAEIKIRDISTTELVVSSQVNDFSAEGETGLPKVAVDTAEQSPYSIIDWVEPLGQLRLKPEEINSLPVTINIPKNASPGGYYGVIRFTASPPNSQGTSVSLSASLGTLVFLRVSGDAKEQLELKEFSGYNGGSKLTVFESIPIDFSARIENLGNVYEQPVGQIGISDMFGNPVADINVNLDRRTILPGSIRDYRATLDKSVIGDRVLFGLYHAKLTLLYGETNKTVSGEISFWVIPWRLIIGVLALIVIIVVGIRMLISRYTNRVVGRSRGSRRR